MREMGINGLQGIEKKKKPHFFGWIVRRLGRKEKPEPGSDDG